MTQENPFKALKKGNAKRGGGLKGDPPPPQEAGNNVSKPEGSPAVPVRVESVRRQYRISTYINEEAGERLENLIIKVRRARGKKPKIAEVLEQALKAYDETL
jgi:hypothetical protein